MVVVHLSLLGGIRWWSSLGWIRWRWSSLGGFIIIGLDLPLLVVRRWVGFVGIGRHWGGFASIGCRWVGFACVRVTISISSYHDCYHIIIRTLFHFNAALTQPHASSINSFHHRV